MSDPEDGLVTFRATTLAAGEIDVTYSPERARSLKQTLDRDDVTTIVACPDGDCITPITGGVPTREMPRCPRCEQEMHGVVEVEVVDVPSND